MIPTLIVATTRSGVIGIDNKLPWHLGHDLQYFKSVTTGHCVIMGRRTHESIGRPLPNRTNIVLSSSTVPGHVTTVTSMDEALAVASTYGDTSPFVIGGTSVYTQALPYIARAHVTWVEADIEGDATFPVHTFDTGWRVVDTRPTINKSIKNDYTYTTMVYEKL